MGRCAKYQRCDRQGLLASVSGVASGVCLLVRLVAIEAGCKTVQASSAQVDRDKRVWCPMDERKADWQKAQKRVKIFEKSEWGLRTLI